MKKSNVHFNMTRNIEIISSHVSSVVPFKRMSVLQFVTHVTPTPAQETKLSKYILWLLLKLLSGHRSFVQVLGVLMDEALRVKSGFSVSHGIEH